MNNIAQPINYQDINWSSGKEYNKWAGYSRVKAANIMFGKELAKRGAPDGILAFSVYPGSEHQVRLVFQIMLSY